jgi:hypothetical protein
MDENGVLHYPDGREVCDSIKGRAEYVRRRRKAWEDQKGVCALCLKKLAWEEASTDHILRRKMGGGFRDDSQSNIRAVHLLCNALRG